MKATKKHIRCVEVNWNIIKTTVYVRAEARTSRSGGFNGVGLWFLRIV